MPGTTDDMPVTHVSLRIEDYNHLVERDNFLSALEAAGVDNWEGYSEAFRVLEGEDIY